MSCDTSEGVVSIRGAIKDITGVHIAHDVWSEHRKRATDSVESPKADAAPEDSAAAAEAMLRDLGIDPEGNRTAREFLESLRNGDIQLTKGQAQTMRTLAFAIQDAQREAGLMPDLSIPPLPAPGEPPQVMFIRGIPGSGKSSWARKIIETHPEGTVARMNNDDITAMLFGRADVFVPGYTGMYAKIRKDTLRTLLAEPGVRLIILDNTNLNTPGINELSKIATQLGADPVVDDRFLSVPLEECLRRNNNRDRVVPEDVLRDMHRRASRLKPWQRKHWPKVEPFPNDDETLPPLVICDIDGTVADLNGRSPYDAKTVDKDLPRPEVIAMVKGFAAQGIEVQFLSGRDGSAMEMTQEWIDREIGPGYKVHLKAPGDHRPDTVTKPETIHREFAGKYRIITAIDDRESVIHMMRHRLQIPVIQVGNTE